MKRAACSLIACTTRGCAVAGRRRRDAGGEVEVLDAVDVDDPATVAADDLKIGGLRPDTGHV